MFEPSVSLAVVEERFGELIPECGRSDEKGRCVGSGHSVRNYNTLWMLIDGLSSSSADGNERWNQGFQLSRAGTKHVSMK